MNYLNSGSCTPTSCRYCCTPYLNGYYCGTQSQCGACLSTKTATIVIAVVCSVLFLLLIAIILYRICMRKSSLAIFTGQPSPSAILQPNSGQLFGSQFGGVSGSGIIYGHGGSGIYKGNGTVAVVNNDLGLRTNGLNYIGYGSAAAEAQAAVYGTKAGGNIGLTGSAVLYDKPNSNTINFTNQLKSAANTNNYLYPQLNQNNVAGFGMTNTSNNPKAVFNPNIVPMNSQIGSYGYQNSFNVGVNNNTNLSPNGHMIGVQSGLMGIQNRGNSVNQQYIENTGNRLAYDSAGTLASPNRYGTKNGGSIGGISGVSNTFLGHSSPNYNCSGANTALTTDFIVGTDRTLLNTPKKQCFN